MNPHALAGALAELGEYTAYGWGGVVRNLPKAQQLWERSAAAGDARGLYLLGELLLCRSGDLACVFFFSPSSKNIHFGRKPACMPPECRAVPSKC